MSPSGGRHRSATPRRAAVLAAAVAVACVATSGVVWSRIAADPAGPHRGPESSPGSIDGSRTLIDVPVLRARRVGRVKPEVPTGSTLPGGTVVPIRPAGTDPRGLLSVPQDIRTAGWWRGGARLGDPFGSTLLAAHVDSVRQGLGPYAGLLAVTPGQRVTLTSPHLIQVFTIVSRALIPRGSLDRHPRIFSARGPRRLTLVTCAGPYVRARRGYQNLAVIIASPVGDATRRRLR